MAGRVELFEAIRRDYRRERLSIRALAERHKVHRRTVRQALASAVPPPRKSYPRPSPAIGPWTSVIDEILVADQDTPRKQRHTARSSRHTTGTWPTRWETLPHAPWPCRDATWRTVAATDVGENIRGQTAALPAAVDQALARYDFRTACEAIIALAEAGNRFIEDEAPWHLAKTADAGNTHADHRFEAFVSTILTACRVAADELTPFIPNGRPG